MKCVVYSRRLSVVDNENPVPIKEQNDRLRDYAKEHSLKIDAFYEDKSDDPDADKGFVKLKEDGIAGKVNLVLLESIYRCGKSVSEARFLLLETFFVAGIQFIITDDNVDSRDEDYETLKEYFMAKTTQASMINTIERRKTEDSNSRIIPALMECYGYRLSKDRKNIEVDEYAAEIVRRIFWMIGSGMKPKKIADILNAENIECPGKYTHRVYINKPDTIIDHWISDNIIRIRDNIKYVGGSVETIFGIFTYPQIIDQGVFDKAKDKITKRKKSNDSYDRYFNPFTDLIYYKDNGEKLILRTADDKKEERYFRFRQHKKKIIGFKELYDEVMKVITMEKEKALSVLDMIEKEKLSGMKEMVKEEYRDRARAILEECKIYAAEGIKEELEYEKGNISISDYEKQMAYIQEKINTSNEKFGSLIRESDKRLRKLNRKNKWLSIYSVKRRIGRGANNELISVMTAR
ncbi:MAG: recombinase family protein [Butyrivibrio sp.]|uniref:recombinase family protein n=1 Tax=Butyrivibrio sp. TaxID=28121 RepID=UPI001B23A6FA|nr:recombinase family protein [Butyrivibrio sp.]MBO6239489.1 recombinase family protein [Butyrivibrio sp.]MBP3239094.1 recombinase family protein [Oribacterium sp.]